MTDPELKAMQVLIEQLDELDYHTVKRVMIWLASRYDVDVAAPRRLARKDGGGGGSRRNALTPKSSRPKLDNAGILALLRSA